MVRMNEEARKRAREAVEAAFRATDAPVPARRCPSCGHEAATLAARCPACNKRYDRRLPWLSDRARLAIALASVLLLGGVVAYAAPRISDSRDSYAEKLARERAETKRTEVARIKRLQRPVRGDTDRREDRSAPAAERLEVRAAMVTALEAEILREARKRHAAREFTGSAPREVICGPIVRKSVGGRPVEVGDETDLGRPRGRYDCTAVQRDVVRSGELVGRLGVPFVATIDFARGSYIFCGDVKLPGERGKPLAKVPIAPECIGAEGAERVGDGYALPED